MTRPSHKIIITGTGRAGTTFLVQLLTELGLDTGYRPGSWGRDYFEHSSAGLERDILAEDSPYIVKNPNFCETLPALLATGSLVIDHVLVPVRDLDEASRSRVRVGGSDSAVPGGLVGTSEPAAQKGILAERFHRLMYVLAEHDIAHSLLHFPRIALDADYAWTRLHFLAPGIERTAFLAAFGKVSRPDLIHRYGPALSGRDGEAAERFMRAERRKRMRRRAKRVAAAVAILLAALLLVRLYLALSAHTAPPLAYG